MFYAVNLTRAQLSNSFTFILISYATIYVIFYTTMTVRYLYSNDCDKRQDIVIATKFFDISIYKNKINGKIKIVW